LLHFRTVQCAHINGTDDQLCICYILLEMITQFYSVYSIGEVILIQIWFFSEKGKTNNAATTRFEYM